MISVTIFNEFCHEKFDKEVQEIYPNGIHQAIAEFLATEEDFTVRTVTLDDEDCGLTKEVLDSTDVLLWWGHLRHGDVPEKTCAASFHKAQPLRQALRPATPPRSRQAPRLLLLQLRSSFDYRHFFFTLVTA